MKYIEPYEASWPGRETGEKVRSVEAIERRHWSKQTRIEAGKRPAEERVRDFREIYLQYAAEEAVMLEAQRCLECKEP